MPKYYVNWSILDGKLGPEVGRIVIYAEYILRSNGPSKDHNDLLRSLAAKFRLDKNQVIARANRYYWKRDENGDFIISPVRKIDEEDLMRQKEAYAQLIKAELR